MGMASESEQPRKRPSALLIVVRYVIPAIVVIGGIALMTADHSSTAAEGAGGIIGAGLAIFAANWFFRIGARGDSERDVEAAARDYYSVNGVWPTDEERKRFAREGRWHEDQDLPEPVAGPTGQ